MPILFDIAISLILLLAGFLLHRVFKKLDLLEDQDRKLTEQIGQIRVAMPSNYVTKTDLSNALEVLIHQIERLEKKMDNING